MLTIDIINKSCVSFKHLNMKNSYEILCFSEVTMVISELIIKDSQIFKKDEDFD